MLYECSKSNNVYGILNNDNPYFIAGYGAGYVIMLLWRHCIMLVSWCFIFSCLGYYKKCRNRFQYDYPLKHMCKVVDGTDAYEVTNKFFKH